MKLLTRVQRSVQIVEERTVLLDVPDHIIQQHGDITAAFFAVYNPDYDTPAGPWEVVKLDTSEVRAIKGPEIVG